MKHLNLKPRQVPKNVLVVSIDAKSIQVALNGLLVVVVGPMQQTVHMPADMTAHVVLQASLHQLISLLLLVGAVENQALHGLSLTAVRELLQNGVGSFDSLPVLLRLIAANHSAEKFCFLLWQSVISKRCKDKGYSGKVMKKQ